MGAFFAFAFLAFGARAGVGYDICKKDWASGDFAAKPADEKESFCRCLGAIYEDSIPAGILETMNGIADKAERNEYAKENISIETMQKVAETAVKNCEQSQPAQ
jgi:hypothetical protein